MDLPLFDRNEGERRREEGMRRREQNDAPWHMIALPLLREHAKQTTEITSDTFRAFLNGRLDEPNHPNSWGALWGAARKSSIIRDSGRSVISRRPEAHARRLTVWTSLIVRY